MDESEENMNIGIGEVCWNELNTSDVESAERFYTQLFDWDKDSYSENGLDCTLFKAGSQRIGGLVQNPFPKTSPLWLSYIRVQNVDETMAKATKLGAKTLIAPSDVPNVGRIAVFEDLQGAALGLFQPEPVATVANEPRGAQES